MLQWSGMRRRVPESKQAFGGATGKGLIDCIFRRVGAPEMREKWGILRRWKSPVLEMAWEAHKG